MRSRLFAAALQTRKVFLMSLNTLDRKKCGLQKKERIDNG